MLATYLCIGICAIIWIVNGIWIRQAVKERFTSEIYIHTGLGVFFTMLALELTIGIRGAWTHFGISWLGLIGWILYIPSAILVFGSMIELKRKGKPRTYDPSYTTTFVDTGIYGIIRQPITLGMAIWSIALILVFQSILSIILGISVIFCCWMSARKEAEYNIKKFGDNYKEYMKKVPMWNVFNKTKRIKIALIIIIVIVIVVAGLFLTGLNCSNLSSNDLNLKLERSVSELVEKDKSVRNCVLVVTKGDGSYFWAGAAGIANQDGQVPMTKDTPIYIASITKLYTATAIMKLYEEGALSLDDPISKYLPADLIRGIHVYKGEDYSNEITIEHLLSHTSGIPDYYEEKSSKDGKNLFELFLEEPERSWTVDETIARARDDLEPHLPPGTDAFYSDTNFQLLGMIIENVTHKPLHIVYEDFFFRPLGLKHTWLIGCSEPQVAPSAAPADIFYRDMIITNTRSNGAYWADGGIVSTAEEMIIFLKALNEGKIISRDTLELMHDWHKLEFPIIQYGYGTMYFKLPWLISKVTGLTPLWGHSGSTGSFLYYSEDLNLYMAGSINSADSKSKPFFTLMRDVMKLFNTKCKSDKNKQKSPIS